MNVKEKGISWILERVRLGDDQGVLALYSLLYRSGQDLFSAFGAIPRTEKDDLFQDAFTVLEKMILQNRFSLFHKENSARAEARLKQYFARILQRIVYSCATSVYRVLIGVKAKRPIAVEQLVNFLQGPYFKRYAEHLAQQFSLKTVEAGDFLSKSSIIFLDKIAEGHFQLEAETENETNLKKVSKYYCQIIYRQVSKWRRDQQRATSRTEKYQLDKQEQTEPAPDTLNSGILAHKVTEIFENLDQAGKFIMKACYFDQLSPRQIAQKSPFQQYRSTEMVNQKKLDCLRKLGSDLFSVRAKLSAEELKKLSRITRFVIEHLAEPCKSILRYAFPPENKAPDEIALLLQANRPPDEVQNLTSAAQVKKRKYKCKLNLWEELWQVMLNPQENN